MGDVNSNALDSITDGLVAAETRNGHDTLADEQRVEHVTTTDDRHVNGSKEGGTKKGGRRTKPDVLAA